jgi:hypothetical protein
LAKGSTKTTYYNFAAAISAVFVAELNRDASANWTKKLHAPKNIVFEIL